jgi:hypothetical protein
MTENRRLPPDRQASPQARPRVRGRAVEPIPRRLGPIPITPTGVLLVVALIGSVAYVLYAITVRDPRQIPLLASGLAVLGVVFVAIAVTGLLATWRSSIRGRDARALGHALLGGVAWLAAAGCFAGAIILGMVSKG